MYYSNTLLSISEISTSLMWNNLLRKLWNRNLTISVKWNTPLTFAKQIFHSEAISHCGAIFHTPQGVFRWKNRQSCIKIDGFFWQGQKDAYCFAICLAWRPKALLSVPVCAPVSLKTVINRFLNAHSPLGVQILLFWKKESTYLTADTFFLWQGQKDLLFCGKAGRGSDSPPDCHSLPLLQILFYFYK